MSESRIRIKFAEHEFEVEGPEELVKSQFALFRQLVWPQAAAILHEESRVEPPLSPEAPPFRRMVSVRGRIAYLNIPAKVEDAVLLLLLAQKEFRKNENVTGGEIMTGLRRSGIRIPRADTLLMQHATAGKIGIKGSGRTRRYHLTGDGTERAQEIVARLSPLIT